MDTLLALVGMFISIVLIGIILLQRGRGGGLVGALSGLGGQSAFGTKAGDTFTRITIGIAAAWVILAGVHGHVLRAKSDKSTNLPSRIEIPSKSDSRDDSSTKSDDSKSSSGLGPAITDGTDDVGKDDDLKKKSKTLTPEEADSSDDAKKPEVDPKPTESKDEANPKDDAAKPQNEVKKEDESK